MVPSVILSVGIQSYLATWGELSFPLLSSPFLSFPSVILSVRIQSYLATWGKQPIDFSISEEFPLDELYFDPNINHDRPNPFI